MARNTSTQTVTATDTGGFDVNALANKMGYSTKKLTEAAAALKDVDLSHCQSKSAKIRYLASLGWERSKIAAALDVRYQHVRNVLTQVKK